MRELRGALILCDHLYPTLYGKWVIAGTYTTWLAPPGARAFEFRDGVQAYLRFQVERAGRYECELRLLHRALPAHAPPLACQRFAVEVRDPLLPVELGAQLPPFRVRCPDELTPRPGAPVGIGLLVWLTVGGEDVASSPLDIIFRAEGGCDAPASR